MKGEEGGVERFAEAICPWCEIMRPDSRGRFPVEWLALFPIPETMETLNKPARDSPECDYRGHETTSRRKRIVELIANAEIPISAVTEGNSCHSL